MQIIWTYLFFLKEFVRLLHSVALETYYFATLPAVAGNVSR